MLKKSLFYAVLLFLLFAAPAFSQNVAINADGSLPNPNAMLDVQASNKGLLIPRISTAARLAIPNTKGLLVYDTTTSAFWYNTGAGWQTLGAGGSGGVGWRLDGNTDIDTTSFIGTLVNLPFVVKVNGQVSGFIHPVSHNTTWGFGTGAGLIQPGDTANTAIGANSMSSFKSGDDNTAIGANTLHMAYRCTNNTAVGQLTLFYDTTGSYNTAIGADALYQNSVGNYNTALGFVALGQTSVGNYNTGVGTNALFQNISGNYNTALGYNADVVGYNLTNATAIGNGAIVNASNKVRIGNSAVTAIEGQVPFTTPSDGRFKFDVQEDVKGMDFIRHLRPVTYHFDTERFENATGGSSSTPIIRAAYKKASMIRRSGFIAQEVEQAAEAVGYDFSGIIRPATAQDHYSLSYESFVVPLVKAVQEQQQQIDRLEKEKEQMEKRLTELENKLNTKTQGGATKL